MTKSTHKSPQEYWLEEILVNTSDVSDTQEILLTRFHVWQNPTNKNSLRLTSHAWAELQLSKNFKFIKFELPQAILPKTLIQLERHFTAPYYIKGHKIIYCLGEAEILMLSLHGNNLQQFLDNYSR